MGRYKTCWTKSDLWEEEALDYAEEHGYEVRMTRYGCEFYVDGEEVEHWDYAEEGEEERIRY